MPDSEFVNWVKQQEDYEGLQLPLTHIASCIVARNIIGDGQIKPTHCEVLERSVSFFFYGRPAYRVADVGDVIKQESACPFCFIFDHSLIDAAAEIFAFDTGAFGARFYKHVLHDGFELKNFSLGSDKSLPDRLIKRVFNDCEKYLDGDRSHISNFDEISKPADFEARAYLQLLTSPGRNEPDDRICSIEVTFSDTVQLDSLLQAVVVPHTLCARDSTPDWLKKLRERNVEVVPYIYVPGRSPEHYHTLLEVSVKNHYKQMGILP